MSAPPVSPFRVMDCALTIRSMGRSAQTLRELRDHIAHVPADSLSHHFYDSLLRPAFDHPEYRNDFALWARYQLRDAPLAERMAMLDPLDHPDLEGLRAALLDVIEDRLSSEGEVPHAARGKEFHFLRSQFVVFSTGDEALTPLQLGSMIPRLSTGSVFFHFIDARHRNPRLEDDFSGWLRAWGESCGSIVRRLEAIDVYLWSLSELRGRLAACFQFGKSEGEVP
jgi:hypothetical protein